MLIKINTTLRHVPHTRVPNGRRQKSRDDPQTVHFKRMYEKIPTAKGKITSDAKGMERLQMLPMK
eukprot:3647208-Amphidinium_carterae.1